jgi:hypothetical protein
MPLVQVHIFSSKALSIGMGSPGNPNAQHRIFGKKFAKRLNENNNQKVKRV